MRPVLPKPTAVPSDRPRSGRLGLCGFASQTISNCGADTPHCNDRSRAAAALMEVLIAMMVMSIGVLSVITLFPLAVLRAVQGTKLTHGTIMRYNAEELIEFERGTNNLGHAIVMDPDDDGNALGHFGTHYLVDPLGANLIENQAAYRADFGAAGIISRFDFGINDPGLTNAAEKARAEGLFGSADSWDTIASGVLDTTATTPTSATLVAGVDLTGVNYTTLVSQVVLTDESGRRGVSRVITNIAGQTIDWADNLPAGFAPAVATVQTLDPRAFTWMLCVRNNSVDNPASAGTYDPPPAANADTLAVQCDVVVFYRRPFGTSDEKVYAAAPSGPRQYDVTYDDGQPGYWKRGGFLFDVDNARWYRITKVDLVSVAGPQDVAQLTLERDPPVAISNAAFMRGVVDVYYLGDMAPQ